MSEPSHPPGRWLIVRQGAIAAEEREVLEEAGRQIAARGRPFVTVLLGSSSYDAESVPPSPDPPQELWILEDDALGRGIRRSGTASVRSVTPAELVEAIMTAEKVIQFP